MELIDTHAHLYAQEFAQDIEAVMARSQAHHVRRVYLPNIDMDTVEGMLALEAKYPAHCTAMMGIHPCHIGPAFHKQLYAAEAWLARRPFAAIGEVGMDLHHDKAYQAQQAEALGIQLGWAKQHHLPVVLHCRGSLEEVLSILERHQDGRLRGIVHCFGGSLAQARRVIALGFCLGIGGVVTFKNAGLGPVVAAVGLEHLVLETDAPYLAPVPHRGRRNEPAYLLLVAEKIAALKQVAVATVAEVTAANAARVFAPSQVAG